VGATLEVIGRVAIIPPNFPRANITQAMALIRLDEKQHDYLSEFLFSFLLSKFGQIQIAKLARPSGQYNLNHEEIRSILVPKISIDNQRMFSKLVNNFFEQWENSITKFKNAENILLEKLDLLKWEPKTVQGFIKKSSNVSSSKRLDAEHFQPKYDKIIAKISKFETQKLEKLASQVMDFIKKIPDKNYNYIEISDVDPDIGEVGFTIRQGKELPVNAKINVNGGELIISKVRSTRGAVGVIPNEISNGVCSSAFSIYKISSPMKEYVQVVCKSIIGKLQFEKNAKGTSYPVIEDEHVNEILIPILNTKEIENISALVKESISSREIAKEILDEIKKRVEKYIEASK